ncbi:hypothetical protein [Bacillus sp. Marseille-P3661]|uniref:hypothetical protein n=1 Tax=Bacillus sp. Marseille-P3661 TaxID=1936234 RepID=UPI000C844787|nr:hypothetical protein [Bacillus sp. Marseille-P3661]
MMKKYDTPYFWEKLYHEDAELWKGLFRNEPGLNQDSVILYVYALNANTFQYENSWVVYPNTHALIGFLKYIYLPTVMIGFVKNQSEFDRYYSDNLGRVLEQYESSDYSQDIPFLKSVYTKLDELWDQSRNDCIKQLKRIGKDLYQFKPDEHIHFYFDLFQSPSDMANFLVTTYETDKTLNTVELEDHLGMPKEQWLAISNHVEENIFYEKRFITVLSNHLSHSL